MSQFARLICFIDNHPKIDCFGDRTTRMHVLYRRKFHADVIVYIFANLHTALHIEGNMLDKNWLQLAKELVKLSTW